MLTSMIWHQRFFWLFLALLPTQLGLHFWPEWAGVLGRRVDYLAPTLFLTDLLVFLTIGFWLVAVLSQWAQGNPKSQIPMTKQIPRFKIPKFQTKYLWLVVALVFVGINIFIAPNRYVAMYKWFKIGEFGLLGWYIVRTKPKLSFIITPLAVGVLYSSILAITQFFLQHSVGGLLWWLGERTFGVDTPGVARIALNWSPASPAGGLGFGHWDFGLKLRPYATFPHPNVLGGFLAAVLPLLLMSLLRPMGPMSQMKKRMYVIALVAGVIALLLTFSRSAIIVGAVAIAIAIARMRNYELRIRRNARYIFFIVFSMIIIFLASYFMLHNSSEESVVVRGQLNTAAIKLWQSSPLFGVGLGNFLVRLPEALPVRTIYFLQPVHNIYLLVLSEIGIVGVGLIVLWIASQSQKWRVSLHFSLFTLLLLGLVDHYPLTLQQGQLLLTVLVGMSIVVLQSNKVTK